MALKVQWNSSQMVKKNKQWFSKFLKNVNLFTSDVIFKQFPNSKFVVLKQKEFDNHIYCEMIYILGPYILCRVKNRIKKNSVIKKWIKDNPNTPLGKNFLNKNLHRKLIYQTSNSRRYKIIGYIDADIKEEFYNLDVFYVSVFCGKVFNSKKDLEISKEFISKRKFDMCLFPESYPFSRMKIKKNIFSKGTIYGRYSENGPETYFVKDHSHIKIKKSTLFADEKKTMKKNKLPKIIFFKGLNIVILVCYDLLNPRISYYLSKNKIDLVLVPAMTPKNDVRKWKNFLYVRGQEIQTPIILCSNQDKRKICSSKILYYDIIQEKVLESNNPQFLELKIGKNKLIESPKVHWSWLLKNKIFGPFTKDFD